MKSILDDIQGRDKRCSKESVNLVQNRCKVSQAVGEAMKV